MKRYLKIVSVLAIIIAMQLSSMPMVYAGGQGKSITILFTHDIHDHLLPFNVEQDGKALNLGGMARLSNAIGQERAENPDLLLLDGGDFSMGTLFQTIYASDAPGLRLMGKMGYDVTTLGNHEFDFRAQGLADSLNAAKKSGDKLPQIVASNISYPTDKDGNMTKSLSNLKAAMDGYGVKDYTIIERSGVKIGIFGLFGKDAADCAPMAEVEFTDAIENAKRVTDILKQKEKADLIICLSHSGTWSDRSKSEDEILAKEVPDIDVIISGHTHTKLESPIIAGNTIIGSAGEYGKNLGIMDISMDSDGNWKLGDYGLKQIDGSLPEDSNISQAIEGFKATVQQKYLDNFGLKFGQVLANTPFDFPSNYEVEYNHDESTLGNLITDSYIYAVEKAEGSDYQPITAAIVPCGTIRGSFVKGGITVDDAFNVSSLGIGRDRISGYPLISVYLTGKEIKTVCEVDASISPMMSSAQLFMSGVNFKFNPNRLIFNKVTEVEIQNPDGTVEQLDDDKLYRVVAGLYTAQMLSVVGEKSFGLMSVVPKTSDGTPITDFEDQIIYGSINGNKCELKEWLALAQYLQSFKKADGVPAVPQYYSQKQGRKVVDDDSSIAAIFSNPNTIALVAYVVIIVAAALIIFIIVRIATRKKRRIRRISKNIWHRR